MAKHIVATVEEIPQGGSKIVEVGGRSVGIFNIKGEFYALRNTCPHQGGPLCEGRLTGFVTADKPGGEYRYERRGEILRCPWHGWEYDVTTGQSWVDPASVRTSSYDVEVAAGDALPDGYQPGPYTAETFEVSVDQQYVMVVLPGGR